MSIRLELLALAEHAHNNMPLPRVRQVYIPEPRIDADKDVEFGLVELDDGASGLFYAWLGESQHGISRRFTDDNFIGVEAIVLARYFAGNDDMQRSIGLAAINAISQHFFTHAKVNLKGAANSMGGLSLRVGDSLGMIGNFPSLVRRAQGLQVPVTVVERKLHMVMHDNGVRITLDPKMLSSCNKIICTAATLINDSADEMLEYCRHAAEIAIIGPSAGFFPDPLFARGVAILGGTTVLDASDVIQSQRNGAGLRDCTKRYTLRASDYLGTEHLVASLELKPLGN